VRNAAATLLIAALAVGGVTVPPRARADDVAALRQELGNLKKEYADRVAALEARIAQLESQAVAAASVPTPAPLPAPAPSRSGGGAGTAFNPAVSVILAGNYAQLSQDAASYHIAGFVPTGQDTGPGPRSFNLGESELSLAANVDPYFYANLTAAIHGDDTISVEEAYFKTLALPAGLLIKGGRFFSGIGYLNEIHSHAWDFVDQPLVYQAFLGGQLGQDGVQAKWLAPTDLLLEFGVEGGNGRTFPGTPRDRNGLGGRGAFVHVGDDLGDSASWRLGLSWMERQAEQRTYADLDAAGQPVLNGAGQPLTNAFTGSSRIGAVDALLKWSPHGNPTQHNLKLQGEYLHRVEDGTLAFDTGGANVGAGYRSQQSGWYLQGVYQFMPRWRTGLRYDALASGTPRLDLPPLLALPATYFPQLLAATPKRYTWMLDFNPSEFSRLRIQYALDDARVTVRDRQLLLQYLYSIGAHGAHKF